MRKPIVAFALYGLIVTASGLAGSGEVPADSAAVTADTTLSFRVEAGNRLYPDWKEEHRVGMDELMYLGDTPNTAMITAFMPDLKIMDGEPFNASPFLVNPAVRIFVYADTGAVDSSWVFLNFPPHFYPRSFFKFQLLEVTGYVEPDTSGEED